MRPGDPCPGGNNGTQTGASPARVASGHPGERHDRPSRVRSSDCVGWSGQVLVT